MATVDWSNPCARATALTDAYYRLLTGESVSNVSFSDRSVSYDRGDLESLKIEMNQAKAECAAAGGGRRARYAISAGTRRRVDGRSW